jgi:hypothetical protein
VRKAPGWTRRVRMLKGASSVEMFSANAECMNYQCVRR